MINLCDVQNADLPWADFIRKNVGNPISTTIDLNNIRFIVNELTPNSEAATAKSIKIEVEFFTILIIFL